MKNLEDTGEAFKWLLSQDSAVVAIVGQRTYKNSAPSGADVLPYIIYELVNTNEIASKSLNSTTFIQLYQVTYLASTNSVLKSLGTAIRNALRDKSGNMSTSPYVEVQQIWLEDYRDAFNENSEEDGVWIAQQDYKIMVNAN